MNVDFFLGLMLIEILSLKQIMNSVDLVLQFEGCSKLQKNLLQTYEVI